MRPFKKILLPALIVAVLLLGGGYLYFDKKFTPPDNHLEVIGTVENIPIRWVATRTSPISAVLLPVTISGLTKPFYMQLDFGSPNTVLYSRTLKSIGSKFPERICLPDKENDLPLTLGLGKMTVSSRTFKRLNYGEAVNWNDPSSLNIIGTIGTDLLEKRIIVLDFKRSSCSFLKNVPAGNQNGFSDFKFRKRRILLPATIDNENLTVLYDSGTSAFELITSQDKWQKWNTKNSRTRVDQGNSWGNKLNIISAPVSKEIKIGNRSLDLTEVTYIEGTSSIQNLLMKLSGMQGMIGNKLFIGHVVILDCKNQKFKVQ